MDPFFFLQCDECRELSATHGTPAFFYQAARAKDRWRRLRAALPARVTVAYAVKANPFPPLLQAFAEEGAAFDCASGGELEAAAQKGARRLFFAGPGKRKQELARALELGARIQAEGFEDLERIDQLAAGPVTVNLRVHPLAGGEERTQILGGNGPAAFGVDEEDLPELMQRARRLRHVRIGGLHCFTATNELDAQKLLRTHAAVFELGSRLQQDWGINLEQIDVGGGLGLPYSPEENELDVAVLGQGLAELLAANPWFAGELLLEPGRWLAGPCGLYLTRIVRVKKSRGKTFAILEAGANHLLRPLLTGQPFPVKAIGKKGPQQSYTLAGPLCTSLDRLGEVELPELEAGDLLAFGQTGAYGATEAMTHFLSHPPAKEIWLEEPA